MKEDEKDKTVHEPSVAYSVPKGKRITFFNSFEEAAEADYEFYRNLTPEQRLEVHRILSLQVFGNYEKHTGNRLIFD